jgi:hypothetical protein
MRRKYFPAFFEYLHELFVYMFVSQLTGRPFSFDSVLEHVVVDSCVDSNESQRPTVATCSSVDHLHFDLHQINVAMSPLAITIGAIPDLFNDKYFAERPVLQLLSIARLQTSQGQVFRARFSDTNFCSDRFVIHSMDDVSIPKECLKPNAIVRLAQYKQTLFNKSKVQSTWLP